MKKEHPGERIKQFRKRFKLKQGDFSKAIGMVQSNVSKIEAGKLGLSNSILYYMMAYYAINPDWLKTGRGEMLISPEEYISKGMELLGEQRIGEGILKLLNDPKYFKLQSTIAVGEISKESIDPKLGAYLQFILDKWHQGDETVRGWLMIQLGIAFREVTEKLQEEMKDN